VVHTLVSVHTDEGLVGVESVFTSEALVLASLALLAELYRGENALEPVRVTEKLHQNTFWQGRGGAVTHTISGIDIALWDIFGQVTGQPLSRLLGGVYRDRVRPYASVLMIEPGSLVPTLQTLKDEGFTAFKMGWGPFGRVDNTLDEAIVFTARETVGSQALTSSSPLPISGGEVLTRRQSFLPYLQDHLVDIIQPDVTKVGGISEFLRIAQSAEDNFIRVILHGWNTAVGLAVDLHLAAALPNTDLVEYCTGSAYIDAIVTKQWKLDAEGKLPVPTGPGLGLSFDHEAVRHFTGGVDLFMP
jgi:D-galactarolactone cycloisomerase